MEEKTKNRIEELNKQIFVLLYDYSVGEIIRAIYEASEKLTELNNTRWRVRLGDLLKKDDNDVRDQG